MVEWLSIEQALVTPGLRIAPVRDGVPSPWSEFCKALFHVKKIPFALVSARDPQQGLSRIKQLTGQESLPVVFWETEPPRASWLEQLMLAERLGSTPKLLPGSSSHRAEIIGLVAELAAEGGFGWHRRILLINRLLTEQALNERTRAIGHYLGNKYGYARASMAHSQERCEEIVKFFVSRLQDGRTHICGGCLTAADLAWAAFATLIEPLPPELCSMDQFWRQLYMWTPASVRPEELQIILNHRDAIYREWLDLPVLLR
jgi:glutathione S-transferase